MIDMVAVRMGSPIEDLRSRRATILHERHQHIVPAGQLAGSLSWE